MNEPGKLDAGDVTRMGVEAGNIPDRFLRQRKMIGQEAATILLREETVEAPKTLRHRADIEQVDDQKIAVLGAFDADRPRQKMYDRQIDVAHIVRGIVVLDEASGPVVSLDNKGVARFDPRDH